MKADNSIFAVKLDEMEKQYGKLQWRIRICAQGSREKIHDELQKAEAEYKESTLFLEEKAKACRSDAVAKLSRAQLDYREKTGELMKHQIAEDVHCENNSWEEDEKEADMLYAEFAMDFATLAMQQALISALTALDRQGGIEDDKEKKEKEDKLCRK